MASTKLVRRTIWAAGLTCWGLICLSTGLCCIPSDPPPRQPPPHRLTGTVPAPAAVR